jgi:Flp pilus assembly CpaF family ATPase
MSQAGGGGGRIWPPAGLPSSWGNRPDQLPLGDTFAAPPARPAPRAHPHGDHDDAAFAQIVGALTPVVATALQEAGQEDPEAALTLIRSCVAGWAQEQMRGGVSVTAATQALLAQAVSEELYGMGPLAQIVADPQVENIDINACDQVWVSYRDGRIERGPAVAASDEELVGKVQRWSAYQSANPREFSWTTPLLNAALGEELRLSAVMSVTPHPCVSLRFHRHVDVTLADLIGLGTVDPVLAAFLRAAVRARKDVIISGGTNAGKTTLLRALAAELDPDERIATLETDRELFLHALPERHRNVISFEARQANSEGVGAIGLDALIPQTLRHNPSRIIVGEVRADEAWPMLQAMNSGHEGSMCTIHANSADEVFARLLILSRSGGLDLKTEDIHALVGMAVDFVVHLARDRANRRYVAEVVEVLPPADAATPARNHIFRAGADGRAVPTTVRPHCETDLVDAGFDPALMRSHPGLWPPAHPNGTARR